jgi:DNA-binding CsgD family transcriptional regulator
MQRNCGRPFSWAEVQDRRNLTKEQSRVVDESKTFGLRYGATLPTVGPNGRMSALSVAARVSGPEFEKLFAARRQELEELLRMASGKLELPGVTANVLAARAEKQRPKFRLTPHENASLTHAARGLTRQQIADEMDISINTVKEHLETVLNKLKAKNTTHAVSIAMQAGVIWP